ncbi:MAG: hypothetical protein ACR2ON_00870 [Paracoccaceae bacterium]
MSDKINTTTALENVMILAEERLEQFQDPNYTDADIIIAMDSINKVGELLNILKEGVLNSDAEQTNIALAKDEQTIYNQH